MTATRGLTLFLTVAAAGALRAAAPDAATSSPRLKAISARVGSKGASLTIEATEPVGYSLTRPDPVTVLVDFRNVTMADVANTVVANVKSPIAAVSVEPYESMGVSSSRVRIVLAQPVAHHVRSERNTVVVDFEKASAKTAPYVMPPANQQSAIGNQQSPHVPDAILALQQTADPIAALGLGPSPAPQASAPQGAPVPAPDTLGQTAALPAPVATPPVVRSPAARPPAA